MSLERAESAPLSLERVESTPLSLERVESTPLSLERAESAPWSLEPAESAPLSLEPAEAAPLAAAFGFLGFLGVTCKPAGKVRHRCCGCCWVCVSEDWPSPSFVCSGDGSLWSRCVLLSPPVSALLDMMSASDGQPEECMASSGRTVGVAGLSRKSTASPGLYVTAVQSGALAEARRKEDHKDQGGPHSVVGSPAPGEASWSTLDDAARTMSSTSALGRLDDRRKFRKKVPKGKASSCGVTLASSSLLARRTGWLPHL